MRVEFSIFARPFIFLDMVSYEGPIWEFLFDRVADLDKKSISLVIYSDLFPRPRTTLDWAGDSRRGAGARTKAGATTQTSPILV